MAKRTPSREWKRADDDTDSFPVLTEAPVDEDGTDVDADDQEAPDDEAAPPKPVDEIPMKREVPAWVTRFGEAVVARLPRISAAVVGGLLLCLSFPPFGWWYLAIVAFAPPGVGADPRHHQARRRIRLRLPFRAGVLRPAAAVDQRHGRCRCHGWRCRSWRRCSPLCSVSAPSPCAGCRAGPSGSPASGRSPSGSSRRFRSADSLGV